MRKFLTRPLYLLLVPIVVIVFVTVLLFLLSDGPQGGAFIYQLH